MRKTRAKALRAEAKKSEPDNIIMLESTGVDLLSGKTTRQFFNPFKRKLRQLKQARFERA